MASPEHRDTHGHADEPQDPVESIIHAVPIVLPIVGGVLMFLLAALAVYVA